MGKRSSTLTVLAVALTLAGGVARAETLRFASVFPATHWVWAEGGAKFAERVTEKTKGAITFDSFPAGQLGKEGVGILQSGLADMSVVVPSYEPAKLPLTSVAELPSYYETSCEGTAKLWAVLKEGGPLDQAEYAAQGMVPIYANVLPAFQLVTATKPVETLEDVAGLKLRGNGTAMMKTVSALGAIPVNVTTTEFYDSLSRGTVDGGVYYMGSLVSTGLDAIVRHSLKGTRLGGGATVYAISKRRWDKLAPEAQQAIREAGLETQAELCARLDSLQDEIVDKLEAEGKLTTVTASPQERGRWEERLAPVAEAWAQEMEKTGRPGQAILDAFAAAPADFKGDPK
ncbi:TRAP transporter substrate-binding protein DctP [Paracoccus sp. J39]|uniref:TRAP transporter substrate-binding protein n=1 Tax=Paracoccus sp. J39 TaxID=935848 RepID=UPI0018DB1D5D|nr:TRAP transporter substrate-binding protein DctP [Paracoccus sp. J39]